MTATPSATVSTATAGRMDTHRFGRSPRCVAALGLLLLNACGKETATGEIPHVAAHPIRIVVSPEVRQQYRQSHRWDDPSIIEWEQGTLQFGSEPPTSCELHARGSSTKRFARKSYTVKLLAKQPILPGKKLRRLFLLNLGYDPHKFEMRFAYSCLAELGLFPPRNQLVKLFVNDEPEGLYLLCERHENAIRRAYPDAVSIVRCRNTRYPLVWTKNNANGSGAITKLNAAMQVADPQQRADAFDAILDVDALVAWMAFNSLTKNSDTSGELFLFERRQAGQEVGRFGVMGWDYDEMMSAPPKAEGILHHPLTWASQLDVEKTVLTTPPLVERFRQALRRLLTRQLPQREAEERLADLRIALDAADPAGAKARGTAMESFANDLRDRRKALLRQLTQH